MTTEIVSARELPPIYFDGDLVTTFARVDEAHKRPKGTAKRNFINNNDDYQEGVDYYSLSQADQRWVTGFKIPSRGLTVLTSSGYLKLIRSMRDDKAAEILDQYFKSRPALPSPNQPPLPVSVSTTHVNRTPFRIAFFSDRPHVPWVALEDLVYIYPTGCSALAIKQQIERNFQGELDLTRLAEAPSPTAFTRVEHAVDYAKRWTTSASALINERIEAITLKALDTITQLLDAKPVTQALQLGYDDMEIDPEPPIFDHCPSGYTTFDAAMGQYGYQSGFSTAGFKAFLDDLPEFYYRPNLFDDTSKSRIWRQQDIIRALSSQSDTLALPPRSSQLLLASC